MFCSSCGKKLEAGARFCTFCGAVVEAEHRPDSREVHRESEGEGVRGKPLSSV